MRGVPSDVAASIRRSFGRSAEIDEAKIIVETWRDTVTLSGSVRSWNEHADVSATGYSIPGVRHVRLTIVA